MPSGIYKLFLFSGTLYKGGAARGNMLRKQWGLRRNVRRRPLLFKEVKTFATKKKKASWIFAVSTKRVVNNPRDAQVYTCPHYTTLGKRPSRWLLQQAKRLYCVSKEEEFV